MRSLWLLLATLVLALALTEGTQVSPDTMAYEPTQWLLLSATNDEDQDPSLTAALAIIDGLALPYDHFHYVANKTIVTPVTLPALYTPQGRPKYEAIVMTTPRLSYQRPNGQYADLYSNAMINTLAQFERATGARRVVLASNPFHLESFGMRSIFSGEAAFNLTFDAANARVYTRDVLNVNTTLVFDKPFHYKVNNTRPETNTPLLRYQGLPDEVNVAVTQLNVSGSLQFHSFIDLNTFTDDMASINTLWFQFLTHHELPFRGYRRVLLDVHMDDYFLFTNVWQPSLRDRGTERYRCSPEDMEWHRNYTRHLNQHRLPAGSNFAIELSFNGFGITSTRNDKLYLKSKEMIDDFYWSTHTYSHLSLTVNDQTESFCTGCTVGCYNLTTRYEEAYCEVARNQAVADTFFGVPCGTNTGAEYPQCHTWSPKSIVTPRISGLLNANAIRAMTDRGLVYAVGDNTRDELVPPNLYHGLWTTRAFNGWDGLFIIPRYATEIYFDCALPVQNEDQYHFRYPQYANDTIADIVDREARNFNKILGAFRHDPYMFHQANLVVFNYTRANHTHDTTRASLLTLWIDAVVDTYLRYLQLPVLSVKQDVLGDMYLRRMALDACNATAEIGFHPNLTRVLMGVRVNASGDCWVPVTGVRVLPSAQSYVEEYGPDHTSWLHAKPAQSLFFPVNVNESVLPVTPADVFVNGSGLTEAVVGLSANFSLFVGSPLGPGTRDVNTLSPRLRVQLQPDGLDLTPDSVQGGVYRYSFVRTHDRTNVTLDVRMDGQAVAGSPFTVRVRNETVVRVVHPPRVQKVLVLCATGAASDSGLEIIERLLMSLAVPYEKRCMATAAGVPLPDATTFNLTRSDDGAPLYSAVMMTSWTLGYADPTGEFVAGMTPGLRDALRTYCAKWNIPTVSVVSQPSADMGMENDPGFPAGGQNNATWLGLTEEGHRVMGAGYKANLTVPLPTSYYFVGRVTDPSSVRVLMTYRNWGDRPAVTLHTDDLGGETLHMHALPAIFDKSGPVLMGLLWNFASSGGRFVGVRRQYLITQMDDHFLSTGIFSLPGQTAPTRRATGDDMRWHLEWQEHMRTRVMPANSTYRIELPFNGLGTGKNKTEWEADELFRVSRALRENFYWLTHTYTHLSLTVADQNPTLCTGCTDCEGKPTRLEDAACEIYKNQVHADVFYDGLGCGTRWADLDTDPELRERCWTWSERCIVTPVISGLLNGDALRGLQQHGIIYAVGDNTRNELRATNRHHALYTTQQFNGADGTLIIPRYPTEIYYNAGTPKENLDQYNFRYEAQLGRQGMDGLLTRERNQLAPNLLWFDHDGYMFHQANLVVFPWEGRRASLLSLWVEAIVDELMQFTTFPLKCEKQQHMTEKFLARMALDSCRPSVELLYEPFNGTALLTHVQVEVQGTRECVVPITGVAVLPSPSIRREFYGPDVTAWVTMDQVQRKRVVPVDVPVEYLPVRRDHMEVGTEGRATIRAGVLQQLHIYVVHPSGQGYRNVPGLNFAIRLLPEAPTAAVRTAARAVTEATQTALDGKLQLVGPRHNDSEYTVDVLTAWDVRGTFYADVTLDGVSIPGSPFNFTVVPYGCPWSCGEGGFCLRGTCVCRVGHRGPRCEPVPPPGVPPPPWYQVLLDNPQYVVGAMVAAGILWFIVRFLRLRQGSLYTVVDSSKVESGLLDIVAQPRGLSAMRAETFDVRSFALYRGRFHDTLTTDEKDLLGRYDMLAVDPSMQKGMSVKHRRYAKKHLLAIVDLKHIRLSGTHDSSHLSEEAKGLGAMLQGKRKQRRGSTSGNDEYESLEMSRLSSTTSHEVGMFRSPEPSVLSPTHSVASGSGGSGGKEGESKMSLRRATMRKNASTKRQGLLALLEEREDSDAVVSVLGGQGSLLQTRLSEHGSKYSGRLSPQPLESTSSLAMLDNLDRRGKRKDMRRESDSSVFSVDSFTVEDEEMERLMSSGRSVDNTAFLGMEDSTGRLSEGMGLSMHTLDSVVDDLMAQRDHHSQRDLYDGIVFVNVDEFVERVGVEDAVDSLTEITQRHSYSDAGKRWFVMENGEEVFDKLRAVINGVVLHNCTMRYNGHMRKLPNAQRTELRQYIDRLGIEGQNRADFHVFAVETVADYRHVHPELIERFLSMSWANFNDFRAWVNVDPTMSNLNLYGTNLRPAGPVGLMARPEVQRFMALCEDVPVTPVEDTVALMDKEHEERTQKLRDALQQLDDGGGPVPKWRRQLDGRATPMSVYSTASAHVSLRASPAPTRLDDMEEDTEGHFLVPSREDLSRLDRHLTRQYGPVQGYAPGLLAQLHKPVAYSVFESKSDRSVLNYRPNESSIDFDEVDAPALVSEMLAACSEVTGERVGGTAGWEPLSGSTEGPDNVSGDQHEIGINCTLRERAEVMSRLRLLRDKGVLSNLNQPRMFEVFKDDAERNEVRFEHRREFRAMLDAVAHARELATVHPTVKTMSPVGELSTGEVGAALADLAQELLEVREEGVMGQLQEPRGYNSRDNVYGTRADQLRERFVVQVWHCDPRTLTTAAGHKYYSISEGGGQSSNEEWLDVYVARDHPNIAEAVVHAYMDWRGFTHSHCVYLEHLVSQRTQMYEGDVWDALSDRIVHQLQHASNMELAVLVQQTPAVMQRMRLELSEVQQEGTLDEVGRTAEQVQHLAATLLVKNPQRDQHRTSLEVTPMRNKSEVGGSRLSGLLYHAVTHAMWSDASLSFLESFLKLMSQRMEYELERPMVTELVRRLLSMASQNTAVRLMKNQVRDMYPFPLPSPFSVSVALESLGWNQHTVQHAFGKPLGVLSATVYKQVAHEARKEDARGEEDCYDESSLYESQEHFREEQERAARFSLGALLHLPLLLDLIVMLGTGEGVLMHSAMPPMILWSMQVSLTLSTILAAAPATSVAKMCTALLRTFSFRLSDVVATQRLLSAAMLGTGASIVVALVTVIVLGVDGLWPALVLLLHMPVLTFVTVCTTATTALHTRDYVYSGAWWMNGLSLLLLAAPRIVAVWLDAATLRSAVLPLYFGGLVLCAAWSWHAFLLLGRRRMEWYFSIRLTEQVEILEWYHHQNQEIVPSFAQDDVMAQREHAMELMRARSRFSAAVQQQLEAGWLSIQLRALRLPNSSPEQVVMRRALNHEHESKLVRWYCTVYNRTVPAPVSVEWEWVLQEASDMFQAKLRMEPDIRGGIMWEWEFEHAVFSSLFMVAVFLGPLLEWTHLYTVRTYFVDSVASLNSLLVPQVWGLLYVLMVCTAPFVGLISVSSSFTDPRPAARRRERAAREQAEAEALEKKRRQSKGNTMPDLLATGGFAPADKRNALEAELEDAAMRRENGDGEAGIGELRSLLVQESSASRRGPLLQSLDERQVLKQIEYRRLMRRFALVCFVAMVVCFVGVARAWVGEVRGTLMLYLAENLIGHTLLLWATFTVWFLGLERLNATRALLLSLVVSYVLAGVAFQVWRQQAVLNLAGMLNSILFALYVVIMGFNGKRVNVHEDRVLSETHAQRLKSSMSVSTMRFVGQEENEARKMRVLQHLYALGRTQEPLMELLDPQVDDRVLQLVREASMVMEERKHNQVLSAAFPEGKALLQGLARDWTDGEINVLLVAQDHMQALHVGDEAGGDGVCGQQSMVGYMGVSHLRQSGDEMVLDVFVAVPWQARNDKEQVRVIVEVLLHEYAENVMHMSHHNAVLSELLVNVTGDGMDLTVTSDGALEEYGEVVLHAMDESGDEEESEQTGSLEVYGLPSRIEKQLDMMPTETRMAMLEATPSVIARHSLLGFDVEQHWAEFPLRLRKVLVAVLMLQTPDLRADMVTVGALCDVIDERADDVMACLQAHAHRSVRLSQLRKERTQQSQAWVVSQELARVVLSNQVALGIRDALVERMNTDAVAQMASAMVEGGIGRGGDGGLGQLDAHTAFSSPTDSVNESDWSGQDGEKEDAKEGEQDGVMQEMDTRNARKRHGSAMVPEWLISTDESRAHGRKLVQLLQMGDGGDGVDESMLAGVVSSVMRAGAWQQVESLVRDMFMSTNAMSDYVAEHHWAVTNEPSVGGMGWLAKKLAKGSQWVYPMAVALSGWVMPKVLVHPYMEANLLLDFVRHNLSRTLVLGADDVPQVVFAYVQPQPKTVFVSGRAHSETWVGHVYVGVHEEEPGRSSACEVVTYKNAHGQRELQQLVRMDVGRTTTMFFSRRAGGSGHVAKVYAGDLAEEPKEEVPLETSWFDASGRVLSKRLYVSSMDRAGYPVRVDAYYRHDSARPLDESRPLEVTYECRDEQWQMTVFYWRAVGFEMQATRAAASVLYSSGSKTWRSVLTYGEGEDDLTTETMEVDVKTREEVVLETVVEVLQQGGTRRRMWMRVLRGRVEWYELTEEMMASARVMEETVARVADVQVDLSHVKSVHAEQDAGKVFSERTVCVETLDKQTVRMVVASQQEMRSLCWELGETVLHQRQMVHTLRSGMVDDLSAGEGPGSMVRMADESGIAAAEATVASAGVDGEEAADIDPEELKQMVRFDRTSTRESHGASEEKRRVSTDGKRLSFSLGRRMSGRSSVQMSRKPSGVARSNLGRGSVFSGGAQAEPRSSLSGDRPGGRRKTSVKAGLLNAGLWDKSDMEQLGSRETRDVFMTHEAPFMIAADPYGLIHTEAESTLLDYDLGGLDNSVRSQFVVKKAGRERHLCSTYVNTKRSRSLLALMWQSEMAELGAFHVRELDEFVLRREPLLEAYWKARDRGHVEEARAYLDAHEAEIVCAIDARMSEGVSCPLWHEYADLYRMTTPGSNSVARQRQRMGHKGTRELSVLGLDRVGWLSAAQDVLVSRSEVMGQTKGMVWMNQVRMTEAEMQMHVQMGGVARISQALSVQKVWSHTPEHVYQNEQADVPMGHLAMMRSKTSETVVMRYFVPLVRELVSFVTREPSSREEMEQVCKLMLDMFTYFQFYGWEATWNSDACIKAWFHAWDEQDVAMTANMTEQDARVLLAVYVRLLTPLCAKPRRVTVVHASNHDMQALVGVVTKRVFGSRLVVWEQDLDLRQKVLYLNELQGYSRFVRKSILGLQLAVCKAVLYEADAVVPAASGSMEEWVQMLVGAHDDAKLHSMMERKSHVVPTGVNAERVGVRRYLESKRPTCMMMAAISPVNDIVGAIRAASVIVHEFGLSEYRLIVRGVVEDVRYASVCHQLIQTLGLAHTVSLQGPAGAEVVPFAWCVLECSLSGGVSSNIGQAAMCGVPVVCTDIGAARQMVTDGKSGQVLGRVSVPKDPRALAAAQMDVLCMSADLEALVKRAGEEWEEEQLAEDDEDSDGGLQSATAANRDRMKLFVVHEEDEDALDGGGSSSSSSSRATAAGKGKAGQGVGMAKEKNMGGSKLARPPVSPSAHGHFMLGEWMERVSAGEDMNAYVKTRSVWRQKLGMMLRANVLREFRVGKFVRAHDEILLSECSRVVGDLAAHATQLGVTMSAGLMRGLRMHTSLAVMDSDEVVLEGLDSVAQDDTEEQEEHEDGDGAEVHGNMDTSMMMDIPTISSETGEAGSAEGTATSSARTSGRGSRRSSTQPSRAGSRRASIVEKGLKDFNWAVDDDDDEDGGDGKGVDGLPKVVFEEVRFA